MNASIPVTRVRPHGTYRFVNDDEAIAATDLVRRTLTQQFSDYVDHAGLTHMNWHLASEGMPGWIGRTLNEFCLFAGQPKGAHQMEIIRKTQVQL